MMNLQRRVMLTDSIVPLGVVDQYSVQMTGRTEPDRTAFGF